MSIWQTSTFCCQSPDDRQAYRKVGGSPETPATYPLRDGRVCPVPFSTSWCCVGFQQRYALTGFLACGCQAPVKCYEGSICDLADRTQIAIAKRFRRRQPRNRTGCRTEGRLKFNRLLPDSDPRILKPPVVHLPGFADGPHVLAHHRGCCQQSQQPDLREPAKEETVVLLPGEPSPRGVGVYVVGPTQRKPHV